MSQAPRTTTKFGSPTPLAGFAALLFLSLSLRCASKSTSDNSTSAHGTSAGTNGIPASGQGGTTGGQAGSGTGVGSGSPGGGSPSIAGGGGAQSSGASGASGSSAHGGSSSSQGGAAGATHSCTQSTVTDDCPLPPSTCETDLHTLDFSSATCPAGQCVYTTQTHACTGLCLNDACLPSSNTTSGAPPSPACTPTNEGTAGQAGETAYNAGDCPIPPSTCADTQTLDYYFVQCVNGQCITSTQSLHCAGGCENNTCQGNFTR
jgi:hypothetical protein